LNPIIKDDNITNILKPYLSTIINKKILIWGAWERGKAYQKALNKLNIDISGFIDSNPRADSFGFPEKQVSLPNILKTEHYFVVVSLEEHGSVFEFLDNLGYKEHIDYIYPSKKIYIKNLMHGYSDTLGNTIQGNIKNASVVLSGSSKLIIGKNTDISDNVKISCGWNSAIVIKDNTIIEKNICIVSYDNSYIEIGKNTKLSYNTYIKAFTNSHINIGNNCKFGFNLSIRLEHNSTILIGNNCLFSYDIKVRANHGHSIIDKNKKMVLKDDRKTIIGNHVWCGMGVSILPGTEIGNNCIIGAESLVNKKFADYVTIAGSPAKVIKENTDWLIDDQISYDFYEKVIQNVN